MTTISARFRIRGVMTGSGAPTDHMGREIAVNETTSSFWYGFGEGVAPAASASHLLFRSDGTRLWHDIIGAADGSTAFVGDGSGLTGVEAASVAWADITGKPSTFPPAAHTHPASEISDSTAAGRALLTAADAAAQRTAMALGTAATANVTTSATDTTAGAVTRVGDGGLLLTGAAELIADIDATTTPSGFYRVAPSTTGTFPAGGAVAGSLQCVRQAAGGWQAQILIVAASASGGRAGQMYSRVYSAGTSSWIAWQPIIRALSGTTANRPTGTWRFPGLQYFDTDLGVMIVWTGSAWVSPSGWSSV